MDPKEKQGCLIDSLMTGDQATWSQFVAEHSKLVYSAIHSTLIQSHFRVPDEDVEDLHYRVFESLIQNDYRKLRQFEGRHGCTLASWVRVIAVRKTIDLMRSKTPLDLPQTRLSEDSHESVTIDIPDPSSVVESVMAKEEEQILADLVSRLTPRERLVISLYADGKRAEEIAELLRISTANVYVLKHRAAEQLKAWMEQSHASA